MDRAGFLLLGVRGGAVLATGGALLTEPAGAAIAAPPSDLDLALARLAVGAEIVAAAFYTQALASKKLGREMEKHAARALFNEQEHLKTVSGILSGAGQTPSTPDDFTISFPKGTFDSLGSIAKLGVKLETVLLGAYLGAVEAFGPAELKTTAARIAASEAEHLSVFSELAANRAVGVSFPEPLDLEAASDFLDSYLG